MKLRKRLVALCIAMMLAFALSAAPQAPAKKNDTPKTATKAALLDINTASEADLKKLPGIGDAYAAKIYANRPYRGKNELVQKKLIPQATYDKIRDLIIARQQ